MSTGSPFHIHRAMSTSALDMETVDPCSIFTKSADSLDWAKDSRKFSVPAGPEHEKLELDFSFNESSVEPETPLRRARGQSLTGMVGIVTPQSASRSFSFESLPFTPSMNSKMLPSPVETPLATPLDTQLDNPFDMSCDPKMSGWSFDFGFSQFPPSHQPLAASYIDDGPAGGVTKARRMTLQRTVSSTAIRPAGATMTRYSARSGSVDVRQISRNNSVSSSVGVNPFYCPPSFMRESASTTNLSTQGLFPLSTKEDSPSRSPSRSASSAAAAAAAAAGAAAAAAAAPGTPSGPIDLSGNNFGGLMFERDFDFTGAVEGEDAGVSSSEELGASYYEELLSSDRDDEFVPSGMHHSNSTTSLMTSSCGSSYENYFDSRVGSVGSLSHITPLSRARSASTSSFGSVQSKSTMLSQSPQPLANQDADEEKPFVCHTCTKGFRRMEHLRRHMKTHTQERPYACTIPNCGRKFSRTDNLKAHILTHAKKTGRNLYVEGLAEMDEIKTKRRKSKKPKELPAVTVTEERS